MELLGRYSNYDRLLTNLHVLIEVKPFRSPDQPKRTPKQRQHRLTAEQQAELIERYLAGERAFELAAAYDVNRTTVSEIVLRAGVRRPRSLTDAERQQVIELYGQGWSCARIGEHLGRDPGTVWKALKAAGVKLRPPSSRRR